MSRDLLVSSLNLPVLKVFGISISLVLVFKSCSWDWDVFKMLQYPMLLSWHEEVPLCVKEKLHVWLKKFLYELLSSLLCDQSDNQVADTQKRFVHYKLLQYPEREHLLPCPCDPRSRKTPGWAPTRRSPVRAPAAWQVSWRGSCQVQHRKWFWDCQRMSSLDMSRLPDTHHIYVNVTCLIHQMLRKPHGLDEADTRERSPHSLLQSQKAIFSWLFLTASTIKTMWALGSHKSHDSSITCKNKSIIHQLIKAHDSRKLKELRVTLLHHVTPCYTDAQAQQESKIESIGYVGGSTSQEQWFGRWEYEFLLATRVHPACACGIHRESKHRHR